MITIGKNARIVFVVFKGNINFNVDFLYKITELMENFRTNQKEIDQVLLTYDKDVYLDHLSLAYIYNVCLYLKNQCKKEVFINRSIYRDLEKTVNSKVDTHYEIIPVEQEILRNDLDHYKLHGDNKFSEIVENIATIIVEKNIMINQEKMLLFLKTTIGEIFSNAIYHNESGEYYFFKDIQRNDKDNTFYLTVNVIDYGNTIIKNVKAYFKENALGDITSAECIEWAMQCGNTTRIGSGGYGLDTLVKYIESIKGDLIIVSDEVIYSLINGIKKNRCPRRGDISWNGGLF